MKTVLMLLICALAASPAWSQSEGLPPLDYVAVPDSFKLPAGMTFGSTSGVAINSQGHIFVLHRGPGPLMEFDAGGTFIRALGDGFFDRPHGLRIDAEDNIWATDVAAHVVYKMNRDGRIVLVLGVRGSAGDRHPYGHLPLFNEPNDVAFAPNGDIYVVQGHGKGEPRVLRLTAAGTSSTPGGGRARDPARSATDMPTGPDPRGPANVPDRTNHPTQRSAPNAISC